MQKLIILLLLFVASNCVYMRKTNYNETLLNECLGEEKLTLDNGLKVIIIYAGIHKAYKVVSFKKSEFLTINSK